METLVKFDELKQHSLQAADGELGKIRDIYFDCETWRIRYMAVSEGFLQRHRVHLLPAVALGEVHERTREVMVQLTRDEVLRSPVIDERSVLDRQIERVVYDYYGWPVYWEHEHGSQKGSAHSHQSLVPPGSYSEHMAEPTLLCRLSQIEGCQMRTDGTSMGRVSDVLIDITRWQVIYLQVDPGAQKAKQRYVDANKIRYVNWADGQIVADQNARHLDSQ